MAQDYKFATVEDQHGWYPVKGKPRNKLNKGIPPLRKHTLGSRLRFENKHPVIVHKPYHGVIANHHRAPRCNMEQLIRYMDSRGWDNDTIKHILDVYRARPTVAKTVEVVQGETWNNKS